MLIYIGGCVGCVELRDRLERKRRYSRGMSRITGWMRRFSYEIVEDL